jgi:hypothetical protein
MHVQTLSYRADSGWSEEIDCSLNSGRTLVIAFGAPWFTTQLTPFVDLRARLPDAHIVGCSTAGRFRRALVDHELRGVLLLSNSVGIGVNGSELVHGINEVIGGHAIVTGGVAGDGIRFKKMWVLHEDRPQSGLVAAVGMCGGSLRLGHGSKGGWDMLFELDGRPALSCRSS